MTGVDAAMREKLRRNPIGMAALAILVLVLAACAGPSERAPAFGLGSGTYKVGKPYQVNGIWYYPAEDYSYDETGIASWYGPGFHKERTANGEVFDQNEMTAAHKTLPMPSLVRVTNLDNGRSIVVRINDRGPFVNGRIIDMSWRCAQLLGFDRGGTAKVRVQILAGESRAIAAAARANTQAAYGGAASVAPVTAVAARTRPVEVETLPPPQAGTTVPGATVDGRFLPAPEVAQRPVSGSRQIYVQAGAFTQYNHASRLRDKVATIAPTTISQTVVGQTKFFRVRLGPIESVAKADGILSQVIGTGTTTARVVVD
jgi:rare lipoprotein A